MSYSDTKFLYFIKVLLGNQFCYIYQSIDSYAKTHSLCVVFVKCSFLKIGRAVLPILHLFFFWDFLCCGKSEHYFPLTSIPTKQLIFCLEFHLNYKVTKKNWHLNSIQSFRQKYIFSFFCLYVMVLVLFTISSYFISSQAL